MVASNGGRSAGIGRGGSGLDRTEEEEKKEEEEEKKKKKKKKKVEGKIAI